MPGPPTTLSPLAVLGFTAADAEAYRTLLRRAPMGVGEAADLLRLSPDGVRDLLAKLTGAGLVDVREETVRAFPPEQALNRVIADENSRLAGVQVQLNALRGLIPVLTAEHQKFHERTHDRVTIRSIPTDQVLDTLRGLAAEHGGDLMWLRSDQWRLPDAEAADQWVAAPLREGRRSRVIYPARALHEAAEAVRRRAGLGEHVRILADVPGRLAVIGDSVAILPHRFDVADDTVLVIEQPALVASLSMLFESLWDRALVVPGIGGPGGQRDATQESARTLLLDQLARGSKDEQIARTLGQSLRTVRRRIAELMDEFDASSRFQAGVEAVRRGLL
ncbi:MAG: helix-turn-helix domain-containing protein [Nocardioides sp.]